MRPWLAVVLTNILIPFIPNDPRGIPSHLKVLSVLRFFAEGSYQKGCANDLNHPLSQPSFSRALHEVVPVILNQMSDQFIKFPSTPADRIAVSTK